MEVMISGELRLFDEPEALDYPWELPLYHATPSDDVLRALGKGGAKVGEGGQIDIDEELGRVKTKFGRELERDLALSYVPEHWTEAKLAAWFCRQIRDDSITHASKRNFVSRWVGGLLKQEGFDLATVNRRKFYIRNLIAEEVSALRKEAVKKECQTFLFGAEKEKRVRVGTEYEFEFHPDAYSPLKLYDGKYGDHDFEKHYYPKIGDFDSKEEDACACWLDRQAEVKFWVRNLVRRNGMSFFLQKAGDRFYPDFICKLEDGRILAVEYKGADRWLAAEDDRKIGGLWEEMSGGKCLFVMVTEKNWATIKEKI